MRSALVAFGLLVSVALAGLPAPPAAAAFGTIQPGGPLGNFCTLNWVFDAPDGAVYIGTAGHCVDLGDRASTWGVSGFGSVVYDNDGALDFALIRVDPAHHGRVSAAVAGHESAPTGVAAQGETLVGDLVQYSGWGTVVDSTTYTRENRVGVLLVHGAAEYRTLGTTLFGDSGGPAIHAKTGKALGIVNGIYILPWAGQDYGTTTEAMLGQLAEDGLPVTLRTV